MQRVPVFKKNHQYIVWSGDKNVQYFEYDNLPEYLKSKSDILLNSGDPALNVEFKDADFEHTGAFKRTVNVHEGAGVVYNKFYLGIDLTDEEFKELQKGNDVHTDRTKSKRGPSPTEIWEGEGGSGGGESTGSLDHPVGQSSQRSS